MKDLDIFENFTEETFLLYAARHYNNPCCSDISEFYSDIDRFKYLKKLLKRYYDRGDLQERLILNHIIIIYNCFTLDASTKMIFHKMPPEYWPTLKTFLLYLNYIKDDELNSVSCDPYVIRKLQLIDKP
jgi:hypothetical protein